MLSNATGSNSADTVAPRSHTDKLLIGILCVLTLGIVVAGAMTLPNWIEQRRKQELRQDQTIFAAKRAMTFANLKQVGTALELYMSDHDEVFPSSFSTTEDLRDILMVYHFGDTARSGDTVAQMLVSKNPSAGALVPNATLASVPKANLKGSLDQWVVKEEFPWVDGTFAVLKLPYLAENMTAGFESSESLKKLEAYADLVPRFLLDSEARQGARKSILIRPGDTYESLSQKTKPLEIFSYVHSSELRLALTSQRTNIQGEKNIETEKIARCDRIQVIRCDANEATMLFFRSGKLVALVECGLNENSTVSFGKPYGFSRSDALDSVYDFPREFELDVYPIRESMKDKGLLSVDWGSVIKTLN